MLIIPILFYILNRMSAPTWCYVLLWITTVVVVIKELAGMYTLGKKSK